MQLSLFLHPLIARRLFILPLTLRGQVVCDSVVAKSTGRQSCERQLSRLTETNRRSKTSAFRSKSCKLDLSPIKEFHPVVTTPRVSKVYKALGVTSTRECTFVFKIDVDIPLYEVDSLPTECNTNLLLYEVDSLLVFIALLMVNSIYATGGFNSAGFPYPHLPAVDELCLQNRDLK